MNKEIFKTRLLEFRAMDKIAGTNFVDTFLTSPNSPYQEIKKSFLQEELNEMIEETEDQVNAMPIPELLDHAERAVVFIQNGAELADTIKNASTEAIAAAMILHMSGFKLAIEMIEKQEKIDILPYDIKTGLNEDYANAFQYLDVIMGNNNFTTEELAKPGADATRQFNLLIKTQMIDVEKLILTKTEKNANNK